MFDRRRARREIQRQLPSRDRPLRRAILAISDPGTYGFNTHTSPTLPLLQRLPLLSSQPSRHREMAMARTASQSTSMDDLRLSSLAARRAIAQPSPYYSDTDVYDVSTLRSQEGRPNPADDSRFPRRRMTDELNQFEKPISQPKKSLPETKAKAFLDQESTMTTKCILNEASETAEAGKSRAWPRKLAHLMKILPPGVDKDAAKKIYDEIVVKGDEVHWEDIAGLAGAKQGLKEAVVYPFSRPDLFQGLRQPASGILLFGPPGTGKTMLARAVATESRSTFFSVSASTLTSKYLGDSEKLIRALFALAKLLAPSIIFIDEIDALLSARTGSGDNETMSRVKAEFLIQWSSLQQAAAGNQEPGINRKEVASPGPVLVLAATNLPWAIDEAARRRFVRRQYIPLPEDNTRATQLLCLLRHQNHNLSDGDIQRVVTLTQGFSGSDITALARDAAMGPLRSLGEALFTTPMSGIRPIWLEDFEKSLTKIRPSVSPLGLRGYENWAREFGENGNM